MKENANYEIKISYYAVAPDEDPPVADLSSFYHVSSSIHYFLSGPIP